MMELHKGFNIGLTLIASQIGQISYTGCRDCIYILIFSGVSVGLFFLSFIMVTVSTCSIFFSDVT